MITLRAVLVSAILSSCPTLSSAVEVGAPIPACDLKNFTDGQAVSLAQPGKVVYVDFWASWCGPCGQSMPFLNELHEQLNAKGLAAIIRLNFRLQPIQMVNAQKHSKSKPCLHHF